VVRFKLLLYSWGKNPQYPMYRKLGGPQTWCGHHGEEKNLSSLRRIKPNFLVIQTIGQSTELSWLPRGEYE
jgi:hypothetical protein